MNNIVQLIKEKVNINVLSLFIAQIITVCLGFLKTIIWTQYADASLYGEFLLVTSFVPIVGVLAFTGAQTTLELGAARNKDSLLDKVIKIKTKASLIAAFCFVPFFGYYYFIEQKQYIAYAILAVAILFPLIMISELWKPWLNGKNQLIKYSRNTVLSAFFVTLTTFIAVYNTDQLIIILMCVLLSTISVQSFFLLKERSNIKQATLIEKSTEGIDDFIQYGKKLSYAFMVNSLLMFDKFIVAFFLNAESVAVYGVSLVFQNLVRMVLDLLNKYFIPEFTSQNSIKDIWLKVKKRVTILSLLALLGGTIGCGLISLVFELIFPEQYIAAKYLSMGFLMVAVLGVPATLLMSLLKYQLRNNFMMYCANLNATVKLVFILALVPVLGLQGVLFSYLISTLLLSMFVFSQLYKTLKYEQN